MDSTREDDSELFWYGLQSSSKSVFPTMHQSVCWTDQQLIQLHSQKKLCFIVQKEDVSIDFGKVSACVAWSRLSCLFSPVMVKSTAFHVAFPNNWEVTSTQQGDNAWKWRSKTERTCRQVFVHPSSKSQEGWEQKSRVGETYICDQNFHGHPKRQDIERCKEGRYTLTVRFEDLLQLSQYQINKLLIVLAYKNTLFSLEIWGSLNYSTPGEKTSQLGRSFF